MKLKNKTAVITGGSSGMALATAQLFVQEGAYVFITGRKKEALEHAVQKIGKNVTGVQGDASKLEDLDHLYEVVKKERGSVDILFASAGRAFQADITEATVDQFDKTFDLNVRGTFFSIQKALPLFNDGGSIILNGSMAALKGFPACSIYSASKAAVRSFARTLSVDLKTRQIRVNVISPGTIDTPMLEPLGNEIKGYLTSMIPRGAMGKPEEIATAALFLASDDSSFITGIDLSVDGGVSQI